MVDRPSMGQRNDDRLPAGLMALAADTDAICTAIDRSGAAVVEPPEELASQFTIVSPEGSPLDSIDPASHATAVSLFEVARRHGEAFGEIRTTIDPATVYDLHIFDLSPRYSCLATILRPSHVGADDVAAFQPTPRRMELVLNASGVIISADDATTALLGWPADEIVGRAALDLIDPEDHERSIAFWVDVLAHRGATRRLRQRWLRQDGGVLWVETTESNHLDGQGGGHVAAELVDISEEMAAQTALRAREELLVRLTEALPTGVLQLNAADEIVFSNARWSEITELHQGASFADFIRLCSGPDRNRLNAGITRTRESGIDSELDVHIHTTADNRRVCRLRLCALGDGNASPQSGVLACLEDITESHELQRRLREQAQRDPLTGLLNRSAIMSRLADCIHDARERHRSAAVLFVDLDDFKAVNDRFGHAAGDDLLRRVGDCIKECVRAEDLVGRLGGDEFVVIIPDLMVPAAATALARRLEIEISSLIVAPGERLLSGSVGVGLLDSTLSTADDLLAAADTAMYAAKRRRRRTEPRPVREVHTSGNEQPEKPAREVHTSTDAE